MRTLIDKLLEYDNDGNGSSFNKNYDVKNQLFTKVLVAKEYNFYPKLVSLFENDCKNLKERLGEKWYQNSFARYMLYRKYNIKDVRTKCDNFPITECDSSDYSMKYIFKIDSAKDVMKERPWLTIEKNGRKTFFADTMTPAWTVLRSLIEYCFMVDRVEIFEDDSYEDLAGHRVFNFKVPEEELALINDRISKTIGTTSYEAALCDYILENINALMELFSKYLGDTKDLFDFIKLTHSGSGCNYVIVPKELLNRSRDPYINRKIAPNIELPNAGRLWDIVDIPIFLVHRWYMKNYDIDVNPNKYIENLDIDLKILAKLKKETREVKNVKLWLNYYMDKGGYDAFIEDYHFEPYVYTKESEENQLLETLSNGDKSYSKKYGFPIELFKGHLYKYDFSNDIDNAKPYSIYKADSVEEDFPLIGYVNGVEDFKQIFKIFKKASEERMVKMI
ncbi:MAG: hypothetical protein IJT67_03940 [Lachnospiraceae bacterium]|nr:hypothetical protein [Lachnospiraceae bacterium]